MTSAMSDLPFEKLYEEGAEALRHYSSAILNIRNVAIAQGFAVLTAEAYLVTEKHWSLLLGAAIFGICLTTVLYALQWNYKRYFDAMLQNVVSLESRICPDLAGPWTTYKLLKISRRGWVLCRFPTLHGLFVLLLLSQLYFFLLGVGENR